MLKGGVVLLLASVAGFSSNFLFSTLLPKDAFGQIFSLFSLVSIVSLILPLGSNSYYLTDKKRYIECAGAIQAFPRLLGVAVAFIFFVARPNLQSVAAGFLLIATTASIQGVLAGQISQNSSQAAIFQAVPSFIKSIAALALLLSLTLTVGPQQSIATDLVLYSLIGASICAIWLIKQKLKVSVVRGQWISLLKGLSRHSTMELFSFWASTVLGIIFSLGIAPLTAKIHGYSLSAYLGIYFIFWSANNIGITAVINNHFWPAISTLRASNVKTASVLKKSLVAANILAAVSLTGTLIVSKFFSEKIWGGFPEISGFLTVSAFALAVRAYSAWIGMMLLSFDGLIKFKAGVQLLGVLLMFFLVITNKKMDASALAFTLVMVEVFGLLGYAFLAILKNRIRRKNDF